MAEYDWFLPNKEELEKKKVKREKYLELWTQGFSEMENGLYACRRGCGTVVHNVPNHRENVCKDDNWNSLVNQQPS